MSAIREVVNKLKSNGREHATSIHNKLNGKSINEKDLNDQGDPMSKNQKRKQARHDEKLGRDQAREDAEEELERRRREEDEQAERMETPEQRARYGTLPINRSQAWPHDKRHAISGLSAKCVGEQVTFRARIHARRVKGSKLGFFIFRQQTATVQGVLEDGVGLVTQHMIRWTGRIHPESIVLVKGTVQTPLEEVKGTSVHDAEVHIESIHVVSEVADTLPFDVHDDEKALLIDGENEDTHVSARTRLDNRIIDLRTSTAQAIFRITSGICNLFRTHLDAQGFIEIHTPKLQGGATESGASVFEVQYFGRQAFLAQSPQLAKQMCISADFEKVYEIGPVFRAENSNTHRHLTEYTGLDLEMAFEEHYHETLHVIDDMLKALFKGVYDRYETEMECVKRQFPHERLVWLDETPIIPFKDGIKLLHESGWTDDSENDDLSTRGEIRLGELVKEKYHTDYYILDKFPTSARPFYTMLDPQDDKFTNSFDIFVRGQEILSGGQRIHNAEMLERRMMEQGIQPETLDEYVEGFRMGAPPHAGGGIGLERLVMLVLALGDIRHASLFPRDPKSLPNKDHGEALRHPEASTLHPPWERHHDVAQPDELQPLAKLIANYGDASNTAWLDERYQVWRHDQTGAAVGYVPSGDYAVIVGDPLCDRSQYGRVMQAFLRFIRKETKLKPLWLLVGVDGEDILGGKLGWRTLSCVAEARVNPSVDPAENDRSVDRKIRHAQKEGVTVIDLPAGELPPEDVRQQCDERMQEWLANRKGTQVHLTDLNPWVDPEHRMYFVAKDKDGRICALVAMAQLSPRNGYQAKYSLDFPGAPSGTIELIISHALKAAQEAGAKSVTFGGSAANEMAPGHNLGSLQAKLLSRSYQAISGALSLTAKSDFREKLGAVQDPIYVCYPRNGMGPQAVRAILKFLEGGET